MSLLIFLGLPVLVYFLVLKPFLLQKPEEKSPLENGLEQLFGAMNEAKRKQEEAVQEAQRPHDPMQGHRPSEDGEYIDYEEIK